MFWQTQSFLFVMNSIHNSVMSRLPPFDALIAFEAALRLGSMTRAADELHLTQSAISHRVRKLEDFMGLVLLLRRNPGLTPTPAGLALLDGLKHVLDLSAGLRARSHAAAAPHRLRVGVGGALIDHWLVRRLPDFAEHHPGISIELAVVEGDAPERAIGLDLRILWVDVSAAQAMSTQRPLFREHVFPVCSPALLPKAYTSGDPGILHRLPLLHKRMPGYQEGAEWSWEAWFSRLGLKRPPKEALVFTSIGPAISAALGGAGAVLARSMVVADALAEKRLVRVLPPEMDQLSAKVHIVRWPSRLAGDSRVEAFTSWLCAEANATTAAPRTTKKTRRSAA